jgi:hypothetical protein
VCGRAEAQASTRIICERQHSLRQQPQLLLLRPRQRACAVRRTCPCPCGYGCACVRLLPVRMQRSAQVLRRGQRGLLQLRQLLRQGRCCAGVKAVAAEQLQQLQQLLLLRGSVCSPSKSTSGRCSGAHRSSEQLQARTMQLDQRQQHHAPAAAAAAAAAVAGAVAVTARIATTAGQPACQRVLAQAVRLPAWLLDLGRNAGDAARILPVLRAPMLLRLLEAALWGLQGRCGRQAERRDVTARHVRGMGFPHAAGT